MTLLPDPVPPRGANPSAGVQKSYVNRLEAARAARRKIHELREQGKGMDLEGAKGTYWGALNAVLEYVDHHQKTKGAKLAYALLGDGMDLKAKAFRVIREQVQAV